jgi:hypothetical protein
VVKVPIEQQAAPLAYVEADGLTLAHDDGGNLVLILSRQHGACLGLPLTGGVRGGLVAALEALADGLPDGPAAVH